MNGVECLLPMPGEGVSELFGGQHYSDGALYVT